MMTDAAGAGRRWHTMLMVLPATVALLAGCAGPVATLSGGSGARGLPQSVRLEMAPGATDHRAVAAVAAALDRKGLRADPAAADLMVIGLAQRDARTALATAQGTDVSSAKVDRLLQDCEDRTYRLTLSLHRAGMAPTSGWAEEHHCHGTLDESLAALADGAVQHLVAPGAAVRVLRTGRD